MIFNVDMIEAILIEQDIEGLIKLGAPSDEYSSEAKMLYNRISNEDIKDVSDITVKLIGLFFEQFAVSSEHFESGEKVKGFYFSKTYLNPSRIKRFEIIAELIYKSAKKE